MSGFSTYFQEEILPPVMPGKLTEPRMKAAALAATGPTGLARFGFVQATRPLNWALYNIYRERKDLAHLLKGGEFSLKMSMNARPLRYRGWFGRPLALAVPFPWIDLTPKDLVHPSAASPTRTAKRVAVRSPAAQRSESFSLPPTPGRGKKKSKCPKGHYWSYKHKKCMKSKF